MRSGIQEDALRVMLEGGAVREVLVSRYGDKWGFAIRLGGPGSRCLPVRSRREAFAHVGQFDRCGTLCRDCGSYGIQCGAVAGDNFNANCSIPTTSGPSSLIQVP